MELPYSNAKLEATNNLIKVIKRNALVSGTLKTLKTDFDCFEHKERENEVRSL